MKTFGIFLHTILFIIVTIPSFAAQQSTCYGTTKNGLLKNGIKLPSSGNNFTSYSSIGSTLGRTYVHSEIYKIIINSYNDLNTQNPNWTFVYGETGFKQGGKFKPHKTHQNGLSVDFMVPVTNEQGKSVPLPTSPLNKFGYNIEFNDHGQYDDLKIDFEAIGAHIVALHKNTEKRNLKIWRIIFDPTLQPLLFKSKYGNYLKTKLKFSTKRSWVRHDEHYHIDFIVNCEPMPN